MIHEKLSLIWKRIRFYKRLMVLTLTFNVFAALSGAVCSYLVWDGAFELSAQIIQQEQESKRFEKFEAAIEAAPANQAWLNEVRQDITKRRKSSSEQILKLAKREDQLTSALIWLGSLTLVFGVFIPLLVFGLLTKALRQAQLALQNAARDVVRDWSNALKRHGDAPFKNPQFWVEVLLIFGEQMGQHSGHPAFALTSELSYLVREELHRSDQEAA